MDPGQERDPTTFGHDPRVQSMVPGVIRHGNKIMRLLGRRPRYQEGPPRGGRLREVAPVGGEDVDQTRPRPRCSTTAYPTLTSWMPRPARSSEEVHRNARSSSGRTARGRGFMKVTVQCLERDVIPVRLA